jgi:hypothetical protein
MGMRSALVAATVSTVLALASCSQLQLTDPGAEEMGSIVLTDAYRAGDDGAMYVEGAVGEVILRNSAGNEIARDSEGVPIRFTDLAPGRYTVEPALRPCGGNCGHLDPRTDGCSATIPVETEVVRLHVTYRVGEPCQIHRNP